MARDDEGRAYRTHEHPRQDPGQAPGDPRPRPNGADTPGEGAFFTAADLAGLPVPPREWHVPGMIPRHTVTLLGGDGGVGKSTLAMQLLASTAYARGWLGREVRAGRALYLSAEDDRDELHRRLADIAAAEGLDLAAGENLVLRSLAGGDALLAMLDRRAGSLVTTPLFDELYGFITDNRPDLVCLDTLADLHASDENIRAQARQLIGILRGLAIRHRCAVLVLAHPSLSGLSSGSGSSGSTAWSNSVRARLYPERIADKGHEPNPNRRRLVVKKANYTGLGLEIGMTWREGAFVADEPESGLDTMATGAKAERVFLALLHAFTEEGRHVGHTPGVSYAPALFAKDPRAEGISKTGLEGAMRGLFAKGGIRNEEHGPPSKRRQHVVAQPATV